MKCSTTLSILLLTAQALAAEGVLHAQTGQDDSGRLALSLVQRREIQKELGLDEAQIRQIMQLRSTPRYTNAPTGRQQYGRPTRIQRDSAVQLDSILDERQKRRLREIELQYASLNGLALYLKGNARLASELGLTPQQKTEIEDIVRADIREARKLRRGFGRPDVNQLRELLADQEDKIVDGVLHRDQVVKLDRFKGRPVDPAILRAGN
jgi:hypothetical protein